MSSKWCFGCSQRYELTGDGLLCPTCGRALWGIEEMAERVARAEARAALCEGLLDRHRDLLEAFAPKAAYGIIGYRCDPQWRGLPEDDEPCPRCGNGYATDLRDAGGGLLRTVVRCVGCGHELRAQGIPKSGGPRRAAAELYQLVFDHVRGGAESCQAWMGRAAEVLQLVDVTMRVSQEVEDGGEA